jgi:hypothetical protein
MSEKPAHKGKEYASRSLMGQSPRLYWAWAIGLNGLRKKCLPDGIATSAAKADFGNDPLSQR